MLNFIKFIEILVSLQSIFISTMIPIIINIPFTKKLIYSLDIPITLQIPTIIFISLCFKKNVVYIAFTIYLFIGLFILPIFHQGGSLGYLLTPNFGYLIGTYPLIKIIDNLNNKNKIYIYNFFRNGILAITAMHITGIFYSLLLMIYYKQINIFLYNIGNYTLGKIIYHFLMLIPLYLLIKPIRAMRYRE